MLRKGTDARSQQQVQWPPRGLGALGAPRMLWLSCRGGGTAKASWCPHPSRDTKDQASLIFSQLTGAHLVELEGPWWGLGATWGLGERRCLQSNRSEEKQETLLKSWSTWSSIFWLTWLPRRRSPLALLSGVLVATGIGLFPRSQEAMSRLDMDAISQSTRTVPTWPGPNPESGPFSSQPRVSCSFPSQTS